ncbi:ribosomal RNA small subunit methyltransferase A [bacterium BMS3Abin04]|nr:ribosomal RNA small subunit methyltransferase A [bacterium BMS3Abin04]
MKNIKPLKKFGQNYLIDDNIIKKFVNELDPAPDDCIVEIGPGKGSITQELFNYVDKLIAVEIDNRVISELNEKYSNLNIFHTDVLKLDFQKIYQKCNSKFRIIGNIPFNITSPIVFKLIENRNLVSDSVLIIPLDIAKRFIAQKRTKEYGILTVLLNYFSNVNLCFKISPNVFKPRPKIEAAVVHIFFENEIDSEINNKMFISVVKAAFGNRRKTLKNSLSNSIFKKYNFSKIDLDLSRRAEELDIKDFISLTKFLQVNGK